MIVMVASYPTDTLVAYSYPRDDLLDFVPAGARAILDVGCFRGSTGRSARGRLGDCLLVGLESDPEAAGEARAAYDDVIVGDVEHPSSIDRLSSYTFDAILYGDVLEHLRDPWAVVRKHRRLLRPGGIMVASIPNAVFYDLFVHILIRGRWPRKDEGVFDRTHLRWFTRKDVVDLFVQADLPAEIRRVKYRLVDRPSRLNDYARRVGQLLFPFRRFIAFQYIVVAGPLRHGP